MYGTIRMDRIGHEELLEDVVGAIPGKTSSSQSYRASHGHDHVHLKRFQKTERGYARAKNNVASHLVLEELDIDLPDMSYDPSDCSIATEWIYNAERADALGEGRIQVKKDSYLDSAAARLLIGDADVQQLGENLMIDITGTVHPIDLDHAGYRLDRNISSQFQLDRPLYPQILEQAEDVGRQIGLDVSQHDIEHRAYRLASQLDPGEIAAKLDSHPHLRQFDRKQNFVHNIGLLQERGNV